MTDGIHAMTRGINGASSDVYYHNILLHVLGEQLRIRAGFIRNIPVDGVLGHIGFFEYFKVGFDYSLIPPQLIVEKIQRPQ